ncbi:MAG: 8-amino-7-oxononanoate synthase [Spirochaetales bacterium]|nr:8-amino-7-oxononanoate synthase [Spirochaetales bacterium]|tara:strand:+ start:1066 stop:2601 length:1536 start_codon:yes stop_codon:yes gene_type:complete
MKKNNINKWLSKQLADIKKANLHRTLVEISSSMGPEIKIGNKIFYQFASNNYLGLTLHPRVIASSTKGIKDFGTGTGGSRLVTGTSSLHKKLEQQIAAFKKTEDAIVFSSGYLANIGTISSLMEEGDVIFSDELNHASLIDGCRLSKSKVIIYKHCDMRDLENKINTTSKGAKKKMILTDSVFSMDGDIAPLNEIVKLCDKYDCISMIDEAHATGVLGENGSGGSEFFNLESKIDICMGTLSKAVGSVGGYVAGSYELIDFLKNKARSFVFDTSLPASCLMASMTGIEIIQKNKTLRKKLADNIKKLSEFLNKYEFEHLGSKTSIVPIVIGDEKKTLQVSRFLFDNEIFVPAVRPPSVPIGESRIRITLMALHNQKHMRKLFDTLANAKSIIDKPNRKSKIKLDKKLKPSTKSENQFETFWGLLLGRKINKKKARLEFLKTNTKLTAKQLADKFNELYRNTEHERYVPYPERWLKYERWNDEFVETSNGQRIYRDKRGYIVSKEDWEKGIN